MKQSTFDTSKQSFYHHLPAGLVPSCVELSSTGELCVVGCADGALAVFRVANNGEASLSSVFTIPNAHTAGINCISFSPDDKMIATGGDDTILRLWDVRNGRLLFKACAAKSWITAIHWATTAIAVGAYNGEVTLWKRTKTGKASPGGKKPQNGVALALEVATNNKPIVSIKVLPQENKMLVSSIDGMFRLFDTHFGHCCHTGCLPASLDTLYDATLSPDQRHVVLLAGSSKRTSAKGKPDTSVLLWNRTDAKVVLSFSGEFKCQSRLGRVGALPHGNGCLVFVCDELGHIAFSEVGDKSSTPLDVLECGSPIVDASCGGKLFAAVYDKDIVFIVLPSSTNSSSSTLPPHPHSSQPQSQSQSQPTGSPTKPGSPKGTSGGSQADKPHQSTSSQQPKVSVPQDTQQTNKQIRPTTVEEIL